MMSVIDKNIEIISNFVPFGKDTAAPCPYGKSVNRKVNRFWRPYKEEICGYSGLS